MLVSPSLHACLSLTPCLSLPHSMLVSPSLHALPHSMLVSPSLHALPHSMLVSPSLHACLSLTPCLSLPHSMLVSPSLHACLSLTPCSPSFHAYSCISQLLRNLGGGNVVFTADALGYTPLHYAASYGHKMAVQMVGRGRREVASMPYGDDNKLH